MECVTVVYLVHLLMGMVVRVTVIAVALVQALVTNVINAPLNKSLIPVLVGVRKRGVQMLAAWAVKAGQKVVDSVIVGAQVGGYLQDQGEVVLVSVHRVKPGPAHVVDVIVVHPVRLIIPAVVPVFHL